MKILFKNQDNQFRAGWLILLAFIMMYAGQIAFVMPGITVVSIFEKMANLNSAPAEAMTPDSPFIIFMTLGVGNIGGLAGTFIAWRALNKQKPLDIGLRGNGIDFLFGLFLGATSIAIIFFILLMTNNISMINDFSQPDISGFTFVFLVIFILVGFFEEIFFRGYVMKTMASRHNSKVLIYVMSALLFGAMHLMNPNVSIVGFANIFLIGLLFAYMFDRTGSLWLPIGYHITWNYFQGNIFGFPVSGIDPRGLYHIDISQGNPLLSGGSFGLEGSLLATIVILLGFVVTRFYRQNNTSNITGRW